MINGKLVSNDGCVTFIISEGHELKCYVNTDLLPPTRHVRFQAVSCCLLTAKALFNPMLVHVGLW
jgi:hypothetical protein